MSEANFEAGNFWKDVSIITGHTSNEGILFSDPLINTNDKIKVLVNTNFPNATEATRAKIVNELYPAPRLFGEFSSHFERLNHMLQEFVVTCNTRFLVEAYKGKSWSYVFSVPPGIHAFDLIFTFFRTDLNIGDFQIDFDFPFISGNNLMTGWQSYFTSFVRAGNPNTHRQVFALPFTKNWPLSDVKSNGISALDVNILGFDVETDTDAGNRCDFWKAGAWAGTR